MTGLAGTFAFFFGGDLYDYGVALTASGGLPVGRVYVTAGGERIDQIAHTAYGLQSGALEAILLVNPGLADLSFELPDRVAVVLPDLLPASVSESREVALFTPEAEVDDESGEAASIATPRVYTTVGGERLDQIAHTSYGLQSGALEAILLVNPGLADEAFELDAGIEIKLPTLASSTAAAQAVNREVALWG